VVAFGVEIGHVVQVALINLIQGRTVVTGETVVVGTHHGRDLLVVPSIEIVLVLCLLVCPVLDGVTDCTDYVETFNDMKCGTDVHYRLVVDLALCAAEFCHRHIAVVIEPTETMLAVGAEDRRSRRVAVHSRRTLSGICVVTAREGDRCGQVHPLGDLEVIVGTRVETL